MCYLADHHDVKITCSATIMDEGNSYWSSGQVTGDDYCKIELVSSGLLLMPIILATLFLRPVRCCKMNAVHMLYNARVPSVYLTRYTAGARSTVYTCDRVRSLFTLCCLVSLVLFSVLF